MATTTKYYASNSSSGESEKLEEIDEEEQLMWQSGHQQRRHNNYSYGEAEEEEDYIPEEGDDEDEEEDDELMIEDASSMSSSPSIPDENINFDLVYALHTFVATVEGQASVVKGDALILMEDTNIYWWLVEVLKTREVGYIPAENIETPYERLARLNKHRNVEITSPNIHDIAPFPTNNAAQHPLHPNRRVTIGDESMSKIFHYEVESDIDEDDLTEDQDRLTIEEETITDQDDDHVVYQDAQQNNSNEFHELTYEQDLDTTITSVQDQQQQENWQEKNWEKEAEELLKLEQEAISMQQQASFKEEGQQIQQVQVQKMDLRVFAGNIGQGPLFHTFSILMSMTADELIKIAVNRFGMLDNHIEPSEDTTIEYYLAVQGMDGDEYILSPQDKPFSIFKTLTDSLTTPMPSLSHIRRISQQSMSSTLSTSSRRPRSSSFSNYEQTSFDEDSVIRFYLHRRIKRAIEREGLLYIKVSLYPDMEVITTAGSTEGAFTKNPTIAKLSSKKNKQQQQQQKSEIDRIDKIISVRKEYTIGVVINLALEKFHVPDAQADGYNINVKNDSRQLGKYRMSVRGHGQETELNPNELMSNVLLEAINTPNNSSNNGGPITSDLLFVLRKAGAAKKPTKSTRNLMPTSAAMAKNNSTISNHCQFLYDTEAAAIISEDRRPSILDILMDSTPNNSKLGEQRRPSVMSSLLQHENSNNLPPVITSRSVVEDNYNINNNRRPSGSTMDIITSQQHPQERKSSLNNNNQQQGQQSPCSLSSSSLSPLLQQSTTAKSPTNILFRRSSIQSSSILSGTESSSIEADSTILMDNNNHLLEVTPTSSSSIMTRSTLPPSASTSTEINGSAKKKESLKQQFKRFVGWGSSSNNGNTTAASKKSTAINILPPLQTTNSFIQHGMESPSDLSFVSAPSTPLPPTPGTPRSFTPTKSRQGSTQLHIMENSSNLSRRPSETTTLNDPSTAALAVAAAISNNNKRLSTVSSVSSISNSSTTSSVISEELAAATKQGLVIEEEEEEDESDDEVEKDSSEKVITTEKDQVVSGAGMETKVEQPQGPVRIADTADEGQDIQAQYVMWMNSQPTATTNTTAAVNSPSNHCINSAAAVLNTSNNNIMTKALPPVITSGTNNVPIKNPLRNKSSNISNTTNTTTIVSSSTPSILSKEDKNQESLHPMPPPNNGQQEDLDDLFLLVAHGVDFLTTRENTKWEEEGGYEFHPWNRPQSSFAVKEQSKKDMPLSGDQQEDNSAALAMARSLLLSPSSSTSNSTRNKNEVVETTGAEGGEAEGENKPYSPPLTPLPQQPTGVDDQQQVAVTVAEESSTALAKRILGANNNKKLPSTTTVVQPPQQSVNDEELYHIVASHIVF